MLKFIQKLFDTGGARVGGNSHYLDISSTGALTDAGTQTHDLNNVDITTLSVTTLDSLTTATITTANITTANITTASVSSILKAASANVGGATHYLTVAATGALGDEGTQTHSLNDVDIATLTVSSSIDAVAAITKAGGASHYVSVGTDGALTDTGTQTHNLNDVDITTLTVTTIDSASSITRIGSSGSYTAIGVDGAITDAGTQTHNLNHIDITQADITTATITSASITSFLLAASANVGGAVNYLSVSAAGALGDEGTQTHSLNDLDVTTFTVTTIDSASSITKIGSSGSYTAIGVDGAITDAGTQTHNLNDLDVTTLTVTTLDSVGAVTKAGGSSDYVTIGADGALTDTGTQAHSLNDMTITTLTATTLTAANLGNIKTRQIHLPVKTWQVAGSVTLSTFNSVYPALVLSTACPASESDALVYNTVVLPDDCSTASAINFYIRESHSTAGASNIAFTLAASYLGNGEATAPTGASSTVTLLDTAASTAANAPREISIGTLGTGFAAGDLVLMNFGWLTSTASNIAVNSTLTDLWLEYRATVLY